MNTEQIDTGDLLKPMWAVIGLKETIGRNLTYPKALKLFQRTVKEKGIQSLDLAIVTNDVVERIESASGIVQGKEKK